MLGSNIHGLRLLQSEIDEICSLPRHEWGPTSVYRAETQLHRAGGPRPSKMKIMPSAIAAEQTLTAHTSFSQKELRRLAYCEIMTENLGMSMTSLCKSDER
jgi:hypothetical protein